MGLIVAFRNSHSGMLTTSRQQSTGLQRETLPGAPPPACAGLFHVWALDPLGSPSRKAGVSLKPYHRVMSGSTKSLLHWAGGVLVAAVVAILSIVFVLDIYIALQEPEPVSVDSRR